VAKHLAVLEGARLVERRRHGKEVAFAVRTDRLDLASRWMADIATNWDARLAEIKRLAESRVSRGSS
jgi:DNA-binding transcriptional ArsR family regulator